MKAFRSSLPELPDSFILIFRAYDLFISLVLLFPMVLCLAAALDLALFGGIPSLLFAAALAAVACYLALMIYAFSLDFRSCDFDALEVSGGSARFMLRGKARREFPLSSVRSVGLVRIRLFIHYAYYAEFRSASGAAVAEIAEGDFEALAAALGDAGLGPGPSRSIPFYLSSKSFRR